MTQDFIDTWMKENFVIGQGKDGEDITYSDYLKIKDKHDDVRIGGHFVRINGTLLRIYLADDGEPHHITVESDDDDEEDADLSPAEYALMRAEAVHVELLKNVVFYGDAFLEIDPFIPFGI